MAIAHEAELLRLSNRIATIRSLTCHNLAMSSGCLWRATAGAMLGTLGFDCDRKFERIAAAHPSAAASSGCTSKFWHYAPRPLG